LGGASFSARGAPVPTGYYAHPGVDDYLRAAKIRSNLFKTVNESGAKGEREKAEEPQAH